MPVILALLGNLLIGIAGSVAARVLVGLGIGAVTYSGTNATLGWLKEQAITALQGNGGQWVALLSYMKVGVCISIITSAIVVRATLNGASSDTVKRWVHK